MATSTIPNYNTDKMRWGYRHNVSFNTLITPGEYYCENCTDAPEDQFSWILEVIPSTTSGDTVKQIAKKVTSDVRYERYKTASSGWTNWVQTTRSSSVRDNLSTVKYFQKPGSYNYGTFLILGTFYGVGGKAILCNINNGSISSKINLFTGQAHTGDPVITYYMDSNSVGWVGLETSQSGISMGTIIG